MHLASPCISYRRASYGRASYGQLYIGVHLLVTDIYLAGVRLIGVYLGPRTCLKPSSHRPAYHCVGWHAVMCYGAPEWFRGIGRLSPKTILALPSPKLATTTTIYLNVV